MTAFDWIQTLGDMPKTLRRAVLVVSLSLTVSSLPAYSEVLTPTESARSRDDANTQSLVCGDGACNVGETCSGCSADCGACANITTTWTEDATRNYYNYAQRLSWERLLGDWRDADGVPQGSKPFASKAVVDTNTEQVVELDVTSLVVAYGADIRINRSGGTNFVFHSREATDPVKRPVLFVTRNGATTALSPLADATLNSSTFKSLGFGATLSTRYGFNIRFNQGPDPQISRAILRLTATSDQYGNQTLLVFRPDPHPAPMACPTLPPGSAADVVLRIHGPAWQGLASSDKARTTLNADGSIDGAIPVGSDTGLITRWRIAPQSRAPEMFQRTIMKLHNDFDPDSWGGKMPGLANTGDVDNRSKQCGWGGRVADGTCWSARTSFYSEPTSVPYGRDYLSFGAYAYRVNRTSYNGEGPTFNLPIPRGIFFVVDQRVKLNSIGAGGVPNEDGELSYWLNGQCVLHWTGIVWRNNDTPETLPSELWSNIYVGGTGYAAPHSHPFSIYSHEVSTKLLPFDPAILDQLNGP